MAALDGAVALEQMHQIAMGVAEDLHLDMAGALDQLFQIDLVLAEGRAGFFLGDGHLAGKVFRRADDAHAATTAAPACLEHDRVADRVGEPGNLLHVVGQRIGGRHHRHAGFDGKVARRHLVAEPAHGIGGGADKDDAGIVAGIDEFRAFGQEAVARMDGIDVVFLGDADDFVDGEIGVDGAERFVQMRAATDQIGLIGLEAVQRQLVLFGVDSDGLKIEFIGGAEDADRDFRAVGGQKPFDRTRRG
jgi:hypothetical protein